ncbi:MAG: polyphosphate kinase 2 family protein [Xanthobacteraceae bacterium]|nr:polyphosphate kinase 2 family protein [Xanthobacteraceae bacterium]QYK44229.1 MAG: polyphosphate kinase 2 family protein [Xanthobacteraceae bacterium]
MERSQLVKRFRVADGKGFKLSDYDPRDTANLDIGKQEAKERLENDIKSLNELQERLYAQDRWSVLLIFQAMDAAGKDSAIEHVMSGINPQGCQVHSFKAPTVIELDHDYMWRTTCALPERGRIGVFNRSYYEEVLVVRVRKEILAKQRLPQELVTDKIWSERFEDIRAFERYMARNGTLILKFFLYVSKDEQKKRFLERIDEPEKRWKFNPGDVEERKYWKDYMSAYEDAIRNTAAPHAPWYVVPADRKWFTRLVVAAAIDEAMQGLGLEFPKVDKAALETMMQARETLAKE